MGSRMYPPITRDLARERRALAPKTEAAFDTFSQTTFAEGALSVKMKQIIAVAVAHATQNPYAIKGHTRDALRAGATRAELMEAIWVAAEVLAGGVAAHAALAIDVFDEEPPDQT